MPVYNVYDLRTCVNVLLTSHISCGGGATCVCLFSGKAAATVRYFC